jgi:enoyl-CoA hydratase/carnithine racemase
MAPVPKGAWQLRNEFLGVLRRELGKPAARKDAKTAFFNYALGKPGRNKELPIVKYYFSKGAMARHFEFSKVRIQSMNERAAKAACYLALASAMRLADGHTKLALKLARPNLLKLGLAEGDFNTLSKDFLHDARVLLTLDDTGQIFSAALRCANGHVELAVELARPAFRRIGMTTEEIDYLPTELRIRRDPNLLMIRALLRESQPASDGAAINSEVREDLERLGYEVKITSSCDSSAVADVENGKGIAIGPSISIRKVR